MTWKLCLPSQKYTIDINFSFTLGYDGQSVREWSRLRCGWWLGGYRGSLALFLSGSTRVKWGGREDIVNFRDYNARQGER